MKQISILFFTLLLLGACVKAPTQTDNFVKIVDGRFSVNDKPYYYIGTNFWYAAIGEFYQFNLSSCIRQQNSLTAQFVSFSLSNLANIFYPPQFLQ